MFSYNKNRWRNWGSILTLFIIPSAGQRLVVDQPSIKQRFGAFSKTHMIFEKTVQVHRLANANLRWRFQDPERILEFDFLTEHDQVSLSFLPQRQPLIGAKTAQGTKGDQGFENFSQGNRIRDLSRAAVVQSVQEVFRDLRGRKGLRKPSDCITTSEVPANATARSTGPEPEDSDAAALFLQERDRSSVRLALHERPSPTSVRIKANGRSLEANRDWTLCTDTLVIYDDQVTSDNLVIEYQEQARPILRYPFQLEDHARPLALQAWRLEPNGQWTAIDVNLDGDHLKFKAWDFREGARVRVRYVDSLVEPSVLYIPQALDARSLRLDVDHETCSSSDFMLEKSYMISQCPSTDSWTVSLSYAYDLRQELIELGDEWDTIETEAEWRVLVNGEDFASFLKSGHKILLVGVLPEGAKATLQVSVNL